MYTHNNSKFQSPEHRTPEPLLLTQYTHYKEDYIVSTTTSLKVIPGGQAGPIEATGGGARLVGEVDHAEQGHVWKQD